MCYEDIITEGFYYLCYLAGTEEERVEKISTLIKNADLRRKIGLAGRKTIEQRFSLNANAPRLLKLIKDG